MRCKSTFAGERCSLEHGHGPLHMSTGGRVVWSELAFEDFEDGFDVPVSEDDGDEEEDPDGPITHAVQYYVPFSHVIVTRKRISRKQRDCGRCLAAGVVYDPYTAESRPCPGCQPASS